MEEEKKSVKKKQYIPHKLRSRPFRCITLPAICILIFIAYWLIFCPLVYVVTWNDYNNYYTKTWPTWWPFAFWGVAFIIFVIIMIICVLVWRCIKQKENTAELTARKTEYDTLLLQKNSGVKELYHVSLVSENDTKSKEQLNVSTESLNKSAKDNKKNSSLMNELNKKLSQIEEKNENPEPNFSKCSVKKRPDLNLEKARPLSEISTTSLPRSPLTPRDMFFIDLIEAANSSPVSFIPPTQTFLDNERKNYVPEGIPEIKNDNPPVKIRLCVPKSGSELSEGNSISPEESKSRTDTPSLDSESEYFIANVTTKKSLASEVFLFIDDNEPKKDFKVRMCSDSDNVFTD